MTRTPSSPSSQSTFGLRPSSTETGCCAPAAGKRSTSFTSFTARSRSDGDCTWRSKRNSWRRRRELLPRWLRLNGWSRMGGVLGTIRTEILSRVRRRWNFRMIFPRIRKRSLRLQ
uniref:(northern house mosquito) hypothetical protein n=1 Tax=Culex pipiens TaxID=7175 RepID=A0A8D8KIW5_CULPI